MEKALVSPMTEFNDSSLNCRVNPDKNQGTTPQTCVIANVETVVLPICGPVSKVVLAESQGDLRKVSADCSVAVNSIKSQTRVAFDVPCPQVKVFGLFQYKHVVLPPKSREDFAVYGKFREIDSYYLWEHLHYIASYPDQRSMYISRFLQKHYNTGVEFQNLIQTACDESEVRYPIARNESKRSRSKLITQRYKFVKDCWGWTDDYPFPTPLLIGLLPQPVVELECPLPEDTPRCVKDFLSSFEDLDVSQDIDGSKFKYQQRWSRCNVERSGLRSEKRFICHPVYPLQRVKIPSIFIFKDTVVLTKSQHQMLLTNFNLL
jgi:hypothetical protein